MRRRNLHAFALSLSCVLLAAGCGGDARAGLSASALVTREDAERVLGVPARLRSEEGDGAESTCVYVDAKGDEAMSLQVTVQRAESAEQVRAAEDIAKRVLSESNIPVEPVEGVGDAAWLEKREGSLTLHARKGSVAFLIGVEKGVDREPSYAELERLARRVADRL